MSITELGSLGEFIGSLVVAVTVIILVLQVKQNTLALESASESQASRDFARFYAQTAADPTLVELFYKAQSSPESMTDMEVLRYRWWFSELFYIIESTYRLYTRKQLTTSTWETYLDVLLGHLGNPIVREWWELEMAPFPSEFREIVDKARKDTPVAHHKVPLGTERKST